MLTDRIGVLGLWVDSNAGLAPVGSLLQGNELVLSEAGGHPDRGLPRLAQFGDSDSRGITATMFKGSPVLAYLNSPDQTLAYYDGSWKNVPFIWGVSPLILGTRAQLAVAGETLYATSAYGVQMVDRLDSTALTAGQGDWGVQRAAGLWRPLDVRGAVAGTSGILAANTAAAYRSVMGFTDANGRVHLSAPSQREIVINAPAITVAIGGLVRTGGTTVTVTTATPHGFYVGQTVTLNPGEANFAAGNWTITAVTPLTFTYTEAGANVASTVQQTFTPTAGNVSLTQRIQTTDTAGGPLVAGYWFTQVYRSAITTSASTDPGDDLRLVYEHIWTTAEIAAGSFTFTDSVGDGGRSDSLYTNRYEEGIGNANDPPPLAHALGAFGDHVFYGDLKRKQQLTFTLLAVGAPGGIQVGDCVRLLGYQFLGATTEGGTSFRVYTAGTVSQNIEQTARSLVRVINNDRGATWPFQAAYLSGIDDTPGRILIEEIAVAGQYILGHSPTIDAYTDTTGASTTPRGEAFAPALPSGYSVTAIARAANVVTITTNVNHPFAVNQKVWVGYPPSGTPNANFAVGWKTVTGVPAANQITYAETGSAVAGPANEYLVSTRRLNEIAADDSTAKNAVEISKVGEHDAVPQKNRRYVGSSDARVLCFAELANQWYVFKEDGVWRLIGSTVDDFDWEPAFPSYRLLARDTLKRLGDVLLGLTDRGVVPITPGGMADPISGPVNSLIPMRSADDRTFLAQKAWAYVNPEDGQYVLYALASAGTSGTPDPTGALIWNADAGGWTTTTRHPLIAGIVDQATGYFWAAEAGSNYTRRDLRVGNANDGWDDLDFHDGSASTTIISVVSDVVTTSGDPLINGQALQVGDILKQGGVSARITQVGGGGVVRVQDPTGLSAGAATFYRRIAPAVQWNPFFGEKRGQHHFSEVILHFGESGFGDPTATTGYDTQNQKYGAGYLTFATPAAALDAKFTYFQGLPQYGAIQNPQKLHDVRMAVPDDYARAPWLSPYIRIPLALARWQLDGITFKHRFVSSRVE